MTFSACRVVTTLFLVCVGLLATSQADGSDAASRWHGDYFPNVELTDQDGKRHRFYDDLIKGRTVAINFIYTTCSDVCPAETAQLKQVQDLVGEDLGRTVFMYSISIDPARDTPEVLKAYRSAFGIGQGWSFLTGSLADVQLLQKRLGLTVIDPESVRDHGTSIVLGNEPSATWIRRTPYDEPKVLAAILTERLQKNRAGLGGRASYERAPQITTRSHGQTLFRSRCASCHTIGGGDRLGPDLANVVSSRPRDWLERWLKEPDKMLAEGDPVATGLKARYRNLPMPNFNLGDVDVRALIDYMADQDRKRVRAPDTTDWVGN